MPPFLIVKARPLARNADRDRMLDGALQEAARIVDRSAEVIRVLGARLVEPSAMPATTAALQWRGRSVSPRDLVRALA